MEEISKLDDITLVRAIQHGDETAIEEFYRRFAPGLYCFIRRKVEKNEDLEDVFSETMTSAITAIMRFKGQSQVFTWLCRIAQFKLADFYRARNQRMVLDYEEADLKSLNEGEIETNLVISQSLYHIKREYRQVLEAKYFQGYSIREIAIEMKKSEKAVEAILVRARNAFAKEYQKLAPEMEV